MFLLAFRSNILFFNNGIIPIGFVRVIYHIFLQSQEAKQDLIDKIYNKQGNLKVLDSTYENLMTINIEIKATITQGHFLRMFGR